MAERRGRRLRRENPREEIRAVLPSLDDFMRQNPRSFNDTEDPKDAEQWIASLEKIFRVLDCSDRQRVQWAVYRLEGEADEWWNSFERTTEPEEVENLTWQGFKDMFLDRYFPAIVKNRLAQDFLKIQQEEQEMVIQYQSRFERLSKYDPGIASIMAKKIHHFKQRLRYDIRMYVIAGKHETFKAVIHHAMEVEEVNRREMEEMASRQQSQRKNQSENTRGETSRKSNEGKHRTRSSKGRNRPRCLKCRKRHKGNCEETNDEHLLLEEGRDPRSMVVRSPPPVDTQEAQRTRSCLNCGKAGHFVKKCPWPKTRSM